MSRKNINRVPYFLMVGSAILLTGFLLFWLSREYYIEKETLTDELLQYYNESIYDVEDSVLQEIMYAFFGDRDISRREAFRLIRPFLDDSSRTRTISNSFQPVSADVTILSQGKIVHHVIKAIDSSDFKNKFPDSILIAGLTGSKIFKDPEGYKENMTRKIPALVLDDVKQKLANNSLPISALLVEESEDSISLAEFPQTIISNDRRIRLVNPSTEFTMLFQDYNSTILRRMLPNIILALVVLGAVFLSMRFIFRSLRKQQQLTAIKNDLISNIAHELKTPITTVGVALEAMSNFNALENSEKTEEYIDISRNEVSRLGLLVDKVINTAVFERKELEIKPEAFDIEVLIFDIIKSMKIQFDKFSAKVEFENFANETEVQADRIHITNVIINLLDNAIKYSKGNPHIIIQLAKKGKELILDIIDHGIGIDAEYKSKVFDKFFRVPQGDKHNIKGHGLGLNYVYNVITKHGGSIKVDSELGKGTHFTIALPDTYGRN